MLVYVQREKSVPIEPDYGARGFFFNASSGVRWEGSDERVRGVVGSVYFILFWFDRLGKWLIDGEQGSQLVISGIFISMLLPYASRLLYASRASSRRGGGGSGGGRRVALGCRWSLRGGWGRGRARCSDD